MINSEELKKAIRFFEDELYQFDIELGGVLRKDYREYLENKKSYFELATKTIRKLKGGKLFAENKN